ncbi:type VI secretion system-associated protein TagF [Aromatoleum petrolei]|uniref:Type VI secretion system-associated protein TagF n=1 Tax=Aromatoleum petrolei TaxID=76116 RepID=A0ABX1MR35_9RHOO|nr:type VI secretion system-associated protein TagF [Aromatoleum petrolei]NMF90409.1 type VI secretion system-associated protein TagF [Aromatoleum petrolei]QTQ35697.1 Type VI secretion system-associated protein [Aromatoleum petrolei]
MKGTAIHATGYFGKLPARGDFVKGGGSTQLIAMLDRWISESMNLLSADPRWRIPYDGMSPVHFTFVGPRSRLSVVGHLQPSHDSSSRRFPFLVASTIESEAGHAPPGPLALSSLWAKFGHLVGLARTTDEPASVLHALARIDCSGELAHIAQPSDSGAMPDATTMADLDRLLGHDSGTGQARRIILALGVLLRPLLGSNRPAIERGLRLPLPDDVGLRDGLAQVWVNLIGGFLRSTPCELQLLQAPVAGRNTLIVGFNGATPQPLVSLISPASAPDAVVNLEDPEWIDTHPDLVGDYGVAKLSSYLAQPGTSLTMGLATFREVFFGE